MSTKYCVYYWSMAEGVLPIRREVLQSLLLVSNLQVLMRHIISAFWLACTQLTAWSWTIVAGSWYRRADVRSMDEALDGRPATIAQSATVSSQYRRYICDEPTRYPYPNRAS